jgi:hypothetical protein
LVVLSEGGQQASEDVDSVSQHAAEAVFVSQQVFTSTGAGAQHADSTSWIKLISLDTFYPIDNLRFID